MTGLRMEALLFGVGSLVAAAAAPVAAAPIAAGPDPTSVRALDRIEVSGEAPPEPRFQGMSPSVVDGKLSAGKKSTRIAVDAQPPAVDNALRRLLSRLPGVLVSEMQQPGHFNINYRGLGDPHESEFITGLENGMPIASDWLGYPTLYYLPPSRRVEQIEFIRGGSALMYGPQPGPSLNFITRRPQFDREVSLRSDQVIGSDSLYSTYNEIGAGGQSLAFLLDYDRNRADGERDNADFDAESARLAVSLRGGDQSIWDLELSHYQSDSGEAGRLSSAQFANQRNLTKTPFNRLWIDRQAVALSNNTLLNERWSLHGQYRYSTLDRLSRRSSAFVAPAPPPTSTNFDLQSFDAHLLDLRLVGEVGDQVTVSTGVTWYRDDSPRERRRSNDIDGPQQGALIFQQDRDTRYAAVFAEAIIRLDRLTLVPGLRFEDLSIGIDEIVQDPGVSRAAIARDFDRNETLLGLGALFELGADHQLYGNYSQGYRPMRFDDVGNPTANLALQNAPDPARASNFELGVRGTPMAGVFYDLSVFRIDLDDKIEQRTVNVSDILRINSGDARHQGLEGALEWEVLNPQREAGSASLLLYANAALLDAEITRSESPALVGNEPAFAPDQIFRLGAIYQHPEGLKLNLSASHVSSHYWQDSNLGRGSGADLIAATVPAYTVVDLSAEYPLVKHVHLLAGIGNLFDEDYYSRVRSDGIDPAPQRTYYAGVSLRW